MHNGQKTNMNTRQPRPAAPFAGRSKRWSSNAARPEQTSNQKNAQKYLPRFCSTGTRMLARELLSISIVESSEGAAGTGPEFPASARSHFKSHRQRQSGRDTGVSSEWR